MANWIITEDGDAVNLDMATQVVYYRSEVLAFFASSNENIHGTDYLRLRSFNSESEAKQYIKEITDQAGAYSSEAHRLSEVLA